MPRHDRPRPTPIPKDKTGLSLGYRLAWRWEYMLLSWGGPGSRPLDQDPKERMRRDRLARVEAAKAKKAGTLSTPDSTSEPSESTE